MPGIAHPPRRPADRIRLLISDVDGTLVTPEKALTPAAIDAVRRLRSAGVALAVISSRPPRGLERIAAALDLETPLAGFNAGRIVAADGAVIEERLLPPDAARRAVALIESRGVDVWLFVGNDWLAKNPGNPYVPREYSAVGFDPVIVDDFTPFCERVAKIVGVGADFELLERCEAELKALLAGAAAISRSQPYYLDVTHPEATKGMGVRSLSRLLGIPQEAIAAIGDMENDIAMFVEAGLAIAMGNASPEVKSSADLVTDSNREEGFARAVDRFLLPRAIPG